MSNSTTKDTGALLGALLGALAANILCAVVAFFTGSFLNVFSIFSSLMIIATGAVSGSFFYNNSFLKMPLPPDFPLSANSVSLLFQCLGKFAKDDGRVSEKEAAFVKEQMLEWNFCDSVRKLLKQDFNAGRDSRQTFNQIFEQFVNTLDPSQNNFTRDITHVFVALAYADGELSSEKRDKLIYIATSLNQIVFLKLLLDLFDSAIGEEEKKKQQDQYKRSSKSSYNKEKQFNDASDSACYSEDNLNKYYKILGVSPTATNKEIKKAWRQKAQEFHPDKVQGTGLSEAFVKYATEQLQKINEAYDKICEDRNFRS